MVVNVGHGVTLKVVSIAKVKTKRGLRLKAKVKAKAPREKRDRFDLQHRARESRNSRVCRGALSKLRYKVV